MLTITNLLSIFSYQPNIILGETDTNPEFPNRVFQGRQSTIVQQQLFILRTAISHLSHAYVGHAVEWTDQGKARRRNNPTNWTLC